MLTVLFPFSQDPILSPLHSEGSLSTHVEDYRPAVLDDLPVHKLRLAYPMLPAASAANAMRKSSTFSSHSSDSTPTFIHAGWYDASDASVP